MNEKSSNHTKDSRFVKRPDAGQPDLKIVQADVIDMIISAIDGVAYGEVSIIIQDNKVVQINSLIKTRLIH